MSDENTPFLESELELAAMELSLTVAKNISAARNALNLSQDALAERAQISRATLIQIEGGRVDPQLSTLAKLAAALDSSPSMLLMKKSDLEAIAKIDHEEMREKTESAIGEKKVQEMQLLMNSGMDRQRIQAARMGGSYSRTMGLASGVSGAAIGTMLVPGIGTVIGATLGAFLAKAMVRSDHEPK